MGAPVRVSCYRLSSSSRSPVPRRTRGLPRSQDVTWVHRRFRTQKTSGLSGAGSRENPRSAACCRAWSAGTASAVSIGRYMSC